VLGLGMATLLGAIPDADTDLRPPVHTPPVASPAPPGYDEELLAQTAAAVRSRPPDSVRGLSPAATHQGRMPVLVILLHGTGATVTLLLALLAAIATH
jgi:hypothetical protein